MVQLNKVLAAFHGSQKFITIETDIDCILFRDRWTHSTSSHLEYLGSITVWCFLCPSIPTASFIWVFKIIKKIWWTVTKSDVLAECYMCWTPSTKYFCCKTLLLRVCILLSVAKVGVFLYWRKKFDLFLPGSSSFPALLWYLWPKLHSTRHRLCCVSWWTQPALQRRTW